MKPFNEQLLKSVCGSTVYYHYIGLLFCQVPLKLVKLLWILRVKSLTCGLLHGITQHLVWGRGVSGAWAFLILKPNIALLSA